MSTEYWEYYVFTNLNIIKMLNMFYVWLLHVSTAIGFLLLLKNKSLMCAIGTYVNLLYEFPYVVLPIMYRNERKKF